MKDILRELLRRLDSQKRGYCRIKHKRGWLDLLEDGDLVFNPTQMNNLLWEIIDQEGNRPKGDKLIYLVIKKDQVVKKFALAVTVSVTTS